MSDVMLREILEECRDGVDGIGFNEVVVMLESTAASAEVYMDFDDLRFTPDGRIVTLMVPGGTHMHLDMSKIREAEFVHTTNDQGLPSYQLWMRDGEGEPGDAGLPPQVGRRRHQPPAPQLLHGPAGQVSQQDQPAGRSLQIGGRAPVEPAPISTAGGRIYIDEQDGHDWVSSVTPCHF